MAKPRSTMYNLGLFVRHIVRGVMADPAAGAAAGKERTVRRHETAEQSQHTPAGKLTVRRTVIEEMEIDPLEPRQGPG